MEKQQGESGFIWWHGVVEDVKDPLKLGRCRVRCVGYHTPDKSKIKTSDLPWATPLQSIVSASVSGIGMSPTGLVQGSHVFGFFRDGKEGQMPVILGAFAGIPNQKNPTDTGFSDPDGKYPLEEETPYGNSVLGESDVSRLARGEKTDETIIKYKKDNVKKDIPIAGSDGAAKWSEPETPYKAEYPYNKVFQTESGHVVELDDTPGAERIHVFHKSGTFHEIHPNGSVVQKIEKDNYKVVLGNDFVDVEGTAVINVKGQAFVKVDGTCALDLAGNLSAEINGDSVSTIVEGKTTVISKGDMSLSSGGAINIFGKELKIGTVESILEINSEGIKLNAPGIDLN